MYFTTPYFAIAAPKTKGTKTRGPIRLHKALAWIHGPGMILTPILGAMAYSQKSKGEKVHGIASAHGPVGVVRRPPMAWLFFRFPSSSKDGHAQNTPARYFGFGVFIVRGSRQPVDAAKFHYQLLRVASLAPL